MGRLRRLGRGARAVSIEVRKRRVSLLAAGLAYHLFLTLVPLFIITLIVLEGRDHLSVAVHYVSKLAETSVTGEFLRRITGSDASQLRAGVIAVVLLIWSALRTFQAVNGLFADIYGTDDEERLRTELVEVVAVVVVMAVLVPMLTLAGVTAARFLTDRTWLLMVPVLLFVGFLVAFFPIFYVFPAVDLRPRQAIPGTVLTAAAWTVTGLGFRLYAELSRSVDLYGVVGAVLLLLTWLYLGGLALLVGIVVNANFAAPASGGGLGSQLEGQ